MEQQKLEAKLNRCPFVKQCLSRPEEKPNCIPDYEGCMVYGFYIQEKKPYYKLPRKFKGLKKK